MSQQIFIAPARRNGLNTFYDEFVKLYFASVAKNTITNIPQVKQIIFNDPATIVYWQDGTKTVVKTMHGDTFNEEYGVAMAYVKKIFGSSTGFKKLVAKYKK